MRVTGVMPAWSFSRKPRRTQAAVRSLANSPFDLSGFDFMVFVQFCLKHSRLHQGQEGNSVLNLGPTASPPSDAGSRRAEDVLLDLLQPTQQNPGGCKRHDNLNKTFRATEALSGLIERVTFFNEENGFAVLKVKAKGHRDQVTVVGPLPSVSAGEWLTAEGRWVQDREFGQQFRAEMLTSTAPTTREGIEKYLGSGMVKGIGPVCAKRLVEKFAEQIFDVIETQSARLEEIEGIGPKRRTRIKNAWAEQKVIRNIMVFLHSNGVSTSRAVRIYKTYGENAVETVRNNPYALAKDIHGIGFKTADQIAQKIGVPHDSLTRACAGLSHVLLEATGNGHCALPLDLLLDEAGKLLLVDEKITVAALAKTLSDGDLVQERINDQELVFLPSLKRAEEGIAQRIKNLCALPPAYPPIDFAKAVKWCQGKTGKEFAPSQRMALQQALSSRMLVITGGPGVGKTTLVNAILKILTAKKVKCLLCAPTGRAAKRLSETTGIEARTIHRLLEASPATGKFTRNEASPLACDLLVMDECSMVDVSLMNHLLRALPVKASLLLVGDVDQLPSVGPGMVLKKPDRQRSRCRRAVDQGLPPGRAQPDHHQRPPNKRGPDARTGGPGPGV